MLEIRLIHLRKLVQGLLLRPRCSSRYPLLKHALSARRLQPWRRAQGAATVLGIQLTEMQSGGLFISRKEVEAYDCRNCAFVFADGVAVSATFFAEHAPCFEVRDGVFDGCADSAEGGVELDLAGVEVDTGGSLVRDRVDALDADVAEVGDGREIAQTLRQPGCGAGPRQSRDRRR